MQLNARTWSAIFLILFSTGFISCTPDKSGPRDEFKLSPPRLISEDQKVMEWSELKTYQSLPVKPTARLEFGPEVQGEGVRLNVTSRCQLGTQANLNSHSTFVQPRQVSLLQLLPRLVLLADREIKFSCTFDFVARNSQGSQHFFSMPKVEMTTTNAGLSLPLKQDGLFLPDSPPATLTVPLDQASRYFAVVPLGLSQVGLLCEQHLLQAQTNRAELVAFNQFDPSRAKALGDRDLALDAFPKQNCRVVVSINGELKQISQLLKIDFQRRLTPVVWQDSPVLFNGAFMHFGQGVITNTSSQSMLLEIPPAGKQKVVVRQQTNGQLFEYSLGVRFVVIGKKANALGQLLLASGESVMMQLHATHYGYCSSQARPQETFMSGTTHTLIWFWVNEEVGPEWLQTSSSLQLSTHQGKSSGVWPLLAKGYKRSAWASAPLAKPPEFGDVMQRPAMQGCAMRP